MQPPRQKPKEPRLTSEEAILYFKEKSQLWLQNPLSFFEPVRDEDLPCQDSVCLDSEVDDASTSVKANEHDPIVHALDHISYLDNITKKSRVKIANEMAIARLREEIRACQRRFYLELIDETRETLVPKGTRLSEKVITQIASESYTRTQGKKTIGEIERGLRRCLPEAALNKMIYRSIGGHGAIFYLGPQS